MVGYVLLIVIALSLSILVYGYLKLYLPSERPVCPDGISAIIREASCSESQINITIENRGLLGFEGAYIRVGKEGEFYKELINEEDSLFASLPNQIPPIEKLLPGQSLNLIYDYPSTLPVSLEIELEPYVNTDNGYALCDKAITRKIITCTSTTTSP